MRHFQQIQWEINSCTDSGSGLQKMTYKTNAKFLIKVFYMSYCPKSHWSAYVTNTPVVLQSMGFCKYGLYTGLVNELSVSIVSCEASELKGVFRQNFGTLLMLNESLPGFVQLIVMETVSSVN